MKCKIVKVYAPASIANIGVGFDVLGVALDEPGDYVIAKRLKKKQFEFSVETNVEDIPVSIEQNIAACVAIHMIKQLNVDFGVDLILHKMMSVGTGLGSSAASSVASAVAINALLPKPLSKLELLPFAVFGERVASEYAHADNVAPILFGGACVIRNEIPLDVIPFEVHPSITWIVVTPKISILTVKARGILPSLVSLSDVARQMGNMTGFVLGLMRGDANLIQRCMVDHIAEPYREKLIPGFYAVKNAALEAGAVACGISGSGPAMFAITLSKDRVDNIAASMIEAFQIDASLGSDCYISQTNNVGATIVWEKGE